MFVRAKAVGLSKNTTGWLNNAHAVCIEVIEHQNVFNVARTILGYARSASVNAKSSTRGSGMLNEIHQKRPENTLAGAIAMNKPRR